jgi:hypothetical protein
LVSLCTETHWRCLFKARKVPTSPQILEYRRTGIGWKVYADWMRCASRDFGGDARLRARYWAVHEALVVASVTVADRGQTVAQETLDGRDKYLRIRRFAHETGDALHPSFWGPSQPRMYSCHRIPVVRNAIVMGGAVATLYEPTLLMKPGCSRTRSWACASAVVADPGIRARPMTASRAARSRNRHEPKEIIQERGAKTRQRTYTPEVATPLTTRQGLHSATSL